MTKKEMFAMVMEVVKASDAENRTEMIDFINHEVELLNKKSSKSGESKKNKENEVLLASLVDALGEFSEPVTITDFMRTSTHEVATLSNQKLSALLKKLVDRNMVVRTVEKKRAYFSLVRE